MRSVVLLLLLILLPAGALAETPLWTYAAPAEVAGLSLTPDGSHVLVGGERICLLSGNGTSLWEEWSGEMTASSADGQMIAGAGGLQLVLYTEDASVLWRQTLASDCVALALSPDGTRIVVADLVGEVHFYDADGTRRARADTRGDPDDDEDEFQSRVHDVALSGKGTYVAVASSRGLFYYTGAGRKLWAHEGMLEGGTAVAVSGTGDEVAVASDAGVRLLNRTGALLWTHTSPRPVTALAVSEDGSRVLAGAQDSTLACFDREGTKIWTFTADGWIRDVAVSKDGSRVLAGSMDRQAYLFDGAGKVLGTYALGGWVNHVALTPDGTAGVASSPHEVIGISTTGVLPPSVVPTAAPTGVSPPSAAPTAVPTGVSPPSAAPTAVPTGVPLPSAVPTAVPTGVPLPSAVPTAVPTGVPPPSAAPATGAPAGAPLLFAGLLLGGVALGVGYLHRRRRQVPAPEEKTSPLPEETEEPVAEKPPEEEAPAPWQVSLEEGRTREAARIISQQMAALIEGRTGTRIRSTADVLEACPDRREELAAFFAEADRLVYARALPERGEVEALAAAYLRLAGKIR